MFYEKQPEREREQYKLMLKLIGQLSNLFSESDCPYLAYRVHENVFCKYFHATNHARGDDSADAQKGTIGIGLKTWMGNNDQKVAEFGRLLPQYEHLMGIELVRQIAEYRNERIRVTKKLHGIETMIYHVVKRIPHAMQILECSFDTIDIDNIRLINGRGSETNTYFTDGRHTYHFSSSKHTLYMLFEGLELLDDFEVDILADPYEMIMTATMLQNRDTALHPNAQQVAYKISDEDSAKNINVVQDIIRVSEPERLCLRLYTRRGVKQGREKYVQDKAGLNQWNASGRQRDPDELYISYPAEDRRRNENFFPPRDTPFTLHLPDGTAISAKVCQQGGKAIMSNPNKVLGHWLLRDVFELPEGTLVTYEMLERFGIDSVIFTKNADFDYSVDFSELGTYEDFYGVEE